MLDKNQFNYLLKRAKAKAAAAQVIHYIYWEYSVLNTWDLIPEHAPDLEAWLYSDDQIGAVIYPGGEVDIIA